MNKLSSPQKVFLNLLTKNQADAYAIVIGNMQNPGLHGVVNFYDTPFEGVLVECEVWGLPDNNSDMSPNADKSLDIGNFYGMHIHENGNCSLPFDKTGDHYNPNGMLHPNHAGDMPPLLGNSGYAYSVFYTNRFRINSIVNRSVIIHRMPDDFTTQPSGNSGTKIACGIIRKH